MSTKIKDGVQKELLPFLIEKVPLSYVEKAKKDLNETPETICKGLKALKAKAKEHKKTCDIDFEDDFLLQYLRHRKFDVERAFKQLLNWVEFRIPNSDWFDCTEKNLFSSPNKQYLTMLPKRTPDGCAIYFADIQLWNPEKVSIKEIEREMLMIFCQAYRYSMTQINGLKVIIDFDNTTLKHLRHATPVNLYHLYNMAMNCVPGRYKEIHLVNKCFSMKACMTIAKPFLTAKLRNRIIMHESSSGLLDYFPASVLPVQYGGTLKDYRMTEWLNEAYARHDKFPIGGQPNIA